MNKMKIISFVAIILLIMNLFLPIISNATDEVEEDIEVYEAQIVTPYDTAYITSELL